MKKLAGALVLVALLAGCARPPDLSPRKVVLRTADELGQFWPVANPRKMGPGLMIFTAPGGDIAHWESLARAAQAEGYRVLVCPPPAPGVAETLERAYLEQYGARSRGLHLGGGNDGSTSFVLVCDPPALPMAQVLSTFPEAEELIPAVIAFSPDARNFGEEVEGLFRDMKLPLLLLTCENDPQSLQTAQRIKEVVPGYCELQRYACGVRGADLLAAVPNLPQQILTWLRPITGPGLGKTGS